jgi:deoxyribodipyrimidine photo-lyase
VSGSFSNKKYYANQENINKYCYTRQRDTFPDIPNKNFYDTEKPDELSEVTTPELETALP